MLHRSWVSVYRHLTDPMSSHRGPPSVRSWPALRMMQQDTGRLGLRYAGIYERSLIVGNRGRTLDFCFTPNRRVKVEPSGRSSGLTSPSRKPLDTSVKVAANSALSSSVSPEDLTRIPDLPKSAARLSSWQLMVAGRIHVRLPSRGLPSCSWPHCAYCARIGLLLWLLRRGKRKIS